MAIPEFLSSSFRYLFDDNITDVDTIISDFRSETVTNGDPAWTEPTTRLFKSPVNSVNRWFDVLLTKIDATTLEMRIRNWTYATMTTKRMLIDSTGTHVRFYTGDKHFFIEAERSAPEILAGGFFDCSPSAQDCHNDTVYAGPCQRDIAGVNHIMRQWHFYANQSTGESGRAGGLCSAYVYDAGAVQAIMADGSLIFRPVEYYKDLSPQWCWGRRYQAIAVDYRLQPGSEFDVDIGDNTIGTFKVSGGYIGAAINRVALRIA